MNVSQLKLRSEKFDNNNNNNNNAIFSPDYIDGSCTIARLLIISANNIKPFALVTVKQCAYCEEDMRSEVSYTLRTCFNGLRTAPTLWCIIHGRKIREWDLKRALVTVSCHTGGTDGLL